MVGNGPPWTCSATSEAPVRCHTQSQLPQANVFETIGGRTLFQTTNDRVHSSLSQGKFHQRSHLHFTSKTTPTIRQRMICINTALPCLSRHRTCLYLTT